MSLIDLGTTYLYANSFHNKFPKLDYTILEANPIIKYSWKTLGLNLGMIVGGLIIFAILFLITMNLSEKWLWYLMGVFTMMIIYHFLNFSQLAALKPVG